MARALFPARERSRSTRCHSRAVGQDSLRWEPPCGGQLLRRGTRIGSRRYWSGKCTCVESCNKIWDVSVTALSCCLTRTGTVPSSPRTRGPAGVCTSFHVSDGSSLSLRLPGPVHRDLGFSRPGSRFKNLFFMKLLAVSQMCRHVWEAPHHRILNIKFFFIRNASPLGRKNLLQDTPSVLAESGLTSRFF